MFGLINEGGVWVYIHLIYIKINPSWFSKVYHPTIVPILESTYLNTIHKCGPYASSKCF